MLNSKVLRNRKGLATIEMIPIMIVIALLLNFTIGFFGVIHTGILNSMAARNYAFETFRQRANLAYFHDVRTDGKIEFKRYNSRVHGIVGENRKNASSDRTKAVATIRNIGFGMNPEETGSQDEHEPNSTVERGIFAIREGTRNDSVSTAPVWIRPMYGICLNAKCTQ